MFGRFDRGDFNNRNFISIEELDCYLFETKYGFVQSYDNVLELVNNFGYYSLKEGLDNDIRNLIVEIVSIFNNVKSLVFNNLNEVDIDEMITRLKNLDLDTINENIIPTLKRYPIKQLSKENLNEFEEYKKSKSSWSKRDEDIEMPESIEFINSYTDGTKKNEIFCKDNLTGWAIILKRNSDIRKAIFKDLEDMFNSLNKIPIERELDFEKFGWVEITPLTLHIEVVQGLNILIRALSYLLNSVSYKNNKLLIFDKIEVSNNIETAKIIIKRAVPVINNQRKIVY